MPVNDRIDILILENKEHPFFLDVDWSDGDGRCPYCAGSGIQCCEHAANSLAEPAIEAREGAD